MAGSRFKGLVGFITAGALFMSSTAGVAATSMPAQQQINPWATLTFLTGGAPAAAVCGAAAVAAAAAQPGAGCVLPVMDTPPPPPPPAPPPPPPPPQAGYGITPLLLGLVAVAAGIGFLLAVNGHHHHGNSPG